MYTHDDVLDLLGKAVALKGDGYRDPGVYQRDGINIATDCRYYNVDDAGEPDFGSPSCIVGHVLYFEGIGVHASVNESTGFADLVHELPIRFSDEGHTALMRAQMVQDAGGTWGDALLAAKDFDLQIDTSTGSVTP